MYLRQERAVSFQRVDGVANWLCCFDAQSSSITARLKASLLSITSFVMRCRIANLIK